MNLGNTQLGLKDDPIFMELQKMIEAATNILSSCHPRISSTHWFQLTRKWFTKNGFSTREAVFVCKNTDMLAIPNRNIFLLAKWKSLEPDIMARYGNPIWT